jgi:hypothetical protein
MILARAVCGQGGIRPGPRQGCGEADVVILSSPLYFRTETGDALVHGARPVSESGEPEPMRYAVGSRPQFQCWQGSMISKLGHPA